MTKTELKEMIRECLREELSKKHLHEEADQIEKLAVVFIGNRSNRKAALDKITEPRHTIVFSAQDFLRQYDNLKFDGIEKGNVKLYADAEGMQELRDVLSEVPARIADPILKNTTVLTEGTLTESSGKVTSTKDIKIGDRISYYLSVDPEECWEDALVTDINYNTITVLDPYGAFGETAKLDFSDLIDVEVTPGVWYDLKKLETDDYQNRNGDYPKSGRPDSINVSSSYISFSFKNTPQSTAERWVERYLNSEGFSVAKDAISSYQSGDYHDDWVDVDIQIYKISNNKAALTEGTLTAEEKVDAWHAGTRRENYKAAGIPKLQAYLEIAKSKGYTEIVDIIEDELIRRKATDIFKSKLRDGTVGFRADGTVGPLKSAEPEEKPSTVPTIPWEDLIDQADELLDELCVETDNVFWDDGDGYWSAEVGREWTMRNIYHTAVLNNVDILKRLCDEYSKKLPNVKFYYYEDDFDEDAVSEIGYTAINADYKGI
jgi:hypothetical protein